MERKLVGYVRLPSFFPTALRYLCNLQNPHMPALKTSNVHLDILMGRDDILEPADFMTPGKHSIPNLNTLEHFCLCLCLQYQRCQHRWISMLIWRRRWACKVTRPQIKAMVVMCFFCMMRLYNMNGDSRFKDYVQMSACWRLGECHQSNCTTSHCSQSVVLAASLIQIIGCLLCYTSVSAFVFKLANRSIKLGYRS